MGTEHNFLPLAQPELPAAHFSHTNLMKKPDSLYYKLFWSQAENYKLEEN